MKLPLTIRRNIARNVQETLEHLSPAECLSLVDATSAVLLRHYEKTGRLPATTTERARFAKRVIGKLCSRN